MPPHDTECRKIWRFVRRNARITYKHNLERAKWTDPTLLEIVAGETRVKLKDQRRGNNFYDRFISATNNSSP
jgi:hypothetical protein